MSSYSQVGCEKLVCLSSPLHTSTHHCHTATPHNCLVHYSEVWHLSDLDPAIPALGDCMLQHKFNAEIVVKYWYNCKIQQCWMEKLKDFVWWTGWQRAPMSLIKCGWRDWRTRWQTSIWISSSLDTCFTQVKHCCYAGLFIEYSDVITKQLDLIRVHTAYFL